MNFLKPILFISTVTLLLHLSCNPKEECIPIPCDEGSIYAIHLKVNLEDYSDSLLKKVDIIRINKSELTIHDTIHHSDNNGISLLSKELHLNNDIIESDQREAYNLKIILADNSQHSITNMKIEASSNEECSCGTTIIPSLELNNNFISDENGIHEIKL